MEELTSMNDIHSFIRDVGFPVLVRPLIRAFRWRP